MFKSKNLWQYLIPSLLLIGVVAFDCAQPVSAAYLTGGIGYWSNNGTSIYYNNGNIGIGTTAPATLLHVNGTGATVDAMELITAFTSTRSRFAYWDPASPDTKIAFGSGWGVATDFAVHTKTSGNFSKSTQRFTVKNNGNVGIGTTNPSVKLEVVGTNDHAPLKISRDSNDKQIGISYYPAGALSNSNKGWMMGLEENSNDFSFYNWNGSDPINNILYLTNTNNVGVGSTTPVSKLAVNGLIKMPYYTISAPEDVVNVSYLNSTLSTFNTNNNLWKLNGNDLYASSTTWNVGIGTINTGAKLNISGGEGVYVAPNFGSTNLGAINILNTVSDRRNAITFSSAGSVNAQAGIYVHQDNSTGTHMYLATTNSYATGPQARLTILNNGNVGIGRTPSYKLDVNGTANFTGTVSVPTPTAGGHAATKAYVDDVVFAGTSTSAYVRKTGDTMTGNLDMGGNSISGINKISVGTIDPLYDIKGIKYSTFASAIAGGVKEEYIGQGQIKKCNSQSCYWYLDFDQIEEGSDSWVWRQTVDFRPEKVEVLMTAQGLPTPLSYEFKDNGIIFHAERPTKFSYRLIGARFDWRKWPTLAIDQTEEAGLVID